MQSLFDNGPWPPCPAPFNMAAHVLARAPALAGKSALEVIGPDGAKGLSYGALERAVRGTGTGLLRAGLAPGDIVLLRLGNTPAFPIAYLGAIAAGLVPVPTSAQLTAREVGDMIAQLSPAAILLGEGLAGAPADMGADVPVIGERALAEMHDLPPCDWHMGDPERPGYMIFTSGTSGRARAVVHAHRAIWARAMMHEGWYGLSEDERLCHAGAFNWTYTLGTGLMDPWSKGATALIPAPGLDMAQLPALLAQHEASIFAAAPGVYRKILNHAPRFDPGRLRHGLSAGEKLSETLRARWQAATGTELHEAFGMSECSTFISSAPGRSAAPGSLGWPQQGRRVAIIDEATGAPVPLGEDGTIAVSRRDPGLMLGYHGAEAETAARFRGEWFLTGDHGAMARDGQITYHARVDDMMNAGGYRVSPLEVEAALHDFPGLQDIAATDIEIKPDVRVIAAFYTASAPLDEAALAKHAAARLARYKQPRLYRHLPALPRNANGKLQRQALKTLT